MRILVAEDDPLQRMGLLAILAQLGHEVVECADGDSAWQALRAPAAPRLAFLDWMMPGLNGVDVCSRLREMTDRPYTHVILLSEKGSRDDIATALNAGADSFLAKPANKAGIEAQLHAAMRVINVEDQLFARVAHLESELRRHSLLEHAHHAEGTPPASRSPARPATPATPSADSDTARLLAGLQAGVIECLTGLGLTDPAPVAWTAAPEREISACSAMILRRGDKWLTWLDFRLDMDLTSVDEFLVVLTGAKSESDAERLDAVSETLNILMGPLRLSLENAEIRTVTPYVPASVAGSQLPSVWASAKHVELTLGTAEIRLRLTVYESAATFQEKPSRDIKALDVLSQPLTTLTGAVLMPSFMPFSPARVQKLSAMDFLNRPGVTIPVLVPPSLTRELHVVCQRRLMAS